jgi:hypothetical protein
MFGSHAAGKQCRATAETISTNETSIISTTLIYVRTSFNYGIIYNILQVPRYLKRLPPRPSDCYKQSRNVSKQPPMFLLTQAPVRGFPCWQYMSETILVIDGIAPKSIFLED